MKKLGIIGGVGTAATALFFSRVVEFTQAHCDAEHLDVMLLNRPNVPDRTAFLLGKEGAESFVPAMQSAADELEAAGCEVLATPCNTAHALLDCIAANLSTATFVNMLDETASYCAQRGITCCGVLATNGTLATGVYERALAAQGIRAINPADADQRTVMRVIYDQVKAGIEPDAEALVQVCERLQEQGCDGVILGCTELSCVPLPRYVGSCLVVDALDVLAWRCVEDCGAPSRGFRARYEEE